MSSQESIKASKWVVAVTEASSLAKSLDGYQMRIAELALSVCEITHGGRAMAGKYTLTRFAKEAGVNFRTLSNWVGVKRGILDKLPSYAKKTAKYADLVFVSRELGQSPSAAKVKAVYEKHLSADVFEKRIQRYVCELRSLAYNFKKNAAAFKSSDGVLKEVLFFCRVIIAEIESCRPDMKAEKTMTSKKPRASAARLISKLETEEGDNGRFSL